MTNPTERRFYWLFAILALVGLVADQASKYIVFAKLYPSDHERLSQVDVIPGCFALRTFYTHNTFPADTWLSTLQTLSGPRIPHVNRGALFGIGNDDEVGMNSIFAVISILAGGFIVFWARRPSVAHDRFLTIALGLILGGTVGNLYDRIVFSGVRDFLYCYYHEHVWPDFNIADCCLVCGAGALLAHSFLVGEKATQPKTNESTSTAITALQTTSPTGGV